MLSFVISSQKWTYCVGKNWIKIKHTYFLYIMLHASQSSCTLWTIQGLQLAMSNVVKSNCKGLLTPHCRHECNPGTGNVAKHLRLFGTGTSDLCNILWLDIVLSDVRGLGPSWKILQEWIRNFIGRHLKLRPIFCGINQKKMEFDEVSIKSTSHRIRICIFLK